MGQLEFSINKSRLEDIVSHLERCNNDFIPALNSYVNVNEYAVKLFEKSIRIEAFIENELVGLIGVYFDEESYVGFISNFSLNSQHFGTGLAHELLKYLRLYFSDKNCRSFMLEVHVDNFRAVRFYTKENFRSVAVNHNHITMELATNRDYNKETRDTKDHKYGYSFDFDVMHPFMVKAFQSHFIKGNILELGSFKGDFTRRLMPFFDDITCVEASDEALKIAKSEFGNKVHFENEVFEEVKLPKKYDNIILTHVLEHIDDPVFVLKRINDEWLSDTGRFFLVCPNGNAPSRQIAVKMGLISHNTAITPAEKEHGHRITYSLDTLERDAVAAGLKVVYKTGIFFKALANFQWDKLLNTDIISKEYLEGCYSLGQQYPDLCSSIFLLCEKGSGNGE